MRDTLHLNIWDWLLKGDNAITELYGLVGKKDKEFSTINDENAIIFTPNILGSTETTEMFIRLTVNRYTFTLQQIVPIKPDPNSNKNIKALDFIENICLWVEKKNKNKDFPQLEKGFKVREINVADGYIAGIDELGAKIQIIIEMIFEKRSNENDS